MGFRAQASTLHVVQLLSDLMAMQARQGAQLWLASFDIEKRYDTLPWWALFGVMGHAGIRPSVVACFADFSCRIRRRFRYGQQEGTPWQACNGAAQGCPASPDELSILMEPFHRWARSCALGVVVAGIHIPSVSFADDLVLVAASKAELETLISAYLE